MLSKCAASASISIQAQCLVHFIASKILLRQHSVLYIFAYTMYLDVDIKFTICHYVIYSAKMERKQCKTTLIVISEKCSPFQSYTVSLLKNTTASASPVKGIRRSMQSPQKPVLAQKGRKPIREKPLEEAPSSPPPSPRKGKRPKNATVARNVLIVDNLKTRRRGLKPGRKVMTSIFLCLCISIDSEAQICLQSDQRCILFSH